jgi:hypothetical protein
MNPRLTLVVALLSSTALLSPVLAAEAVDFGRTIRPLLAEKCFQCHGLDAENRETDLRLDTKEGLFSEVDSGGIAVVPGDPSKSVVYQRLVVEDEDQRMPPADSKQLTLEEIDLVKNWIESGATWQQHWSLVAPQRPTAPKVSDAAWPRNELDHFVMARLDREGLKPSPAADKLTLLRRATLDLTGLPPTLEEAENFLADQSEQAYERVVDRLLKSPHYGEHMGRYWLDAARYGDTHGLHLDNFRQIWPYRDWVIKAFNANMSFDQFTIEQLAGDLLPNATLDQKIATGFNRCNVTTSEGGVIPQEYYVHYTNDRVATTSTVWMGISMGCVTCHEHKFDPFVMKDFYQLFAFFNSLDGPVMDGNRQDTAPVVKIATAQQESELSSLDKRISELSNVMTSLIAEVDQAQLKWEAQLRAGAAAKPDLPDEIVKLAQIAPQERNDDQQKKIRDHYRHHVSTHEPLVHAREELVSLQKRRTELDKLLPTTLVWKETAEPKPAHILTRGAYDKKGEQVYRNTPAALPPLQPLPEGSTPTRLHLARWLVSPEHPLTARVTVNRFWQQYFGIGIVETTEDFGSQGAPPSHPQLLDWLAVDFRESGWDVKRLQKMIVMSATYRQSSRVAPGMVERDAANRLLARGPRFRVDAEVIRDTALAISGLLVPKIGGPSVKPYQPPGIWNAVGYTDSNTAKFTRDSGDALYRRSMYTFWKRTAPPPTMSTLDAPSRENCTVRRSRTNTPLAALALMNDEQFVEASRAFAQLAMTAGGETEEERATYAFRLALTRQPSDAELAVLLDVYRSNLARFQADKETATKLINIGESKPDENLDPSELAAWTMIGNLILNLDETVTKG